tara:strand:- start:984 stop:1118 length:135 start_codon:yes stop_codon:yes gene_type:complete
MNKFEINESVSIVVGKKISQARIKKNGVFQIYLKLQILTENIYQ